MVGQDIIDFSGMLGVSPMVLLLGILAIALWTLVWKGLALWSSARGAQKGWFIVLLLVNTVGILEIIYLLFFAKKK